MTPYTLFLYICLAVKRHSIGLYRYHGSRLYAIMPKCPHFAYMGHERVAALRRQGVYTPKRGSALKAARGVSIHPQGDLNNGLI